ncbi:MAG: hypothetical protein RL757_899 [Bacteroidota bacterium]|jgi:polyisoprenoid-binding protein YceI
MKNLVLSALVLVGLSSATMPTIGNGGGDKAPKTVAKGATSFAVDVAKSTFKWTGKKVSGSHWGYIKFSNGVVTAENGTLKGGSFTVDMNSIDCQDTQGEWGAKLVGHLKADDFFGTEKFPTSALVIKSSTAKGNNMYDVVADLTIKGITKEVKFPATVSVSNGQLTATADFNVNRTDYGIRYGSGSFFSNLGDKTINDDFNVSINLVANGAAPAAAPESGKKRPKRKPAKN